MTDEELWNHYMRHGRPAPQRMSVAKFFGNLLTITLMLAMIGVFAIIGALQFGWTPPLWLGPGVQATAVPGAKPLPTAPPYTGGTGGTITTQGGLTSLPPCSIVTDTKTACLDDRTPEPQAAPAPTVETAPAYESSCITPPGARPCWLPPDQPWEAPASVPETPVVLVNGGWHAPLVVPDACANWRPPLVKPEGCP